MASVKDKRRQYYLDNKERIQAIKDDYILYFGKYKGEKLVDIKDHGYLLWLRDQDFIKNNVKEKIEEILKN